MRTVINPAMHKHTRTDAIPTSTLLKRLLMAFLTPQSVKEDRTIAQALLILESRLKKTGVELNSPKSVKSYLRLQLQAEETEHFCVLFLDAKRRLISFNRMFSGTLTSCAVYPREIVKEAIAQNACSAILAHNHPSGNSEPSATDDTLTNILKTALDTIGVSVDDHVIVGASSTYSYAERGRI